MTIFAKHNNTYISLFLFIYKKLVDRLVFYKANSNLFFVDFQKG